MIISYNQQGTDCCSHSMISFHYVTPSDMFVYDFILYHVQQSSHSKILPRKLDFAEVQAKLNATKDFRTSTTTEKILIST